MPPNDGNKLNRLEELKNKLSSRSYKTKIEHRDGFYNSRKKRCLGFLGDRRKNQRELGREIFHENIHV